MSDSRFGPEYPKIKDFEDLYKHETRRAVKEERF